MLYTILRYLYSLVITLALPLIFLRLLWRSRKVPAYRLRWLERLGIFNNPGLPAHGIWLHAVSVGEVVAAVPLINSIRDSYPNLPITVTTTTPTGSQRLRQSMGDTVFHVYMPYDLAWAITLFINKIRPKYLVILETELWPNVLHVCKQKNIPVIIANARLSDKSFARYYKFKSIISKLLQQVAWVAAQSALDAERYVALGMPSTKVKNIGNLKYDVKTNLQAIRQLAVNNRSVLVAASTHAGEEELVLQAFAKVKILYPELLLILVPRHPDRFAEVAKILEKHNLKYMRRTQNNEIHLTTEVLLGDTMGELNSFYAVADIAFVGGSLVPIGGHNLLEPAVFSVPIISGPFTSNFKDICNKLLLVDGLRIVRDQEQLAEQIIAWLASAPMRKQIGANSHLVIEQNSGAAEKVKSLIFN